ncbi:MAG TPA: ABC transporter permease [Candidatus Dorea stercoravium]|nr:ABC transporter permease [Candidatus Dorea stercoravium]
MSSRIYAKLAVTNIKNNGKTYVPFMLTAVLTVMMYYMMDTLARNDSIGNRNVTTVLFLTIPVMTLFSLIFLFYTNSFLIRRRKKEIAVYNILGMGKGHIGRMLTVETLIIWAVSLVLGILGGMVFGKLMHLLLLRILQYDVGIRFHISLPSILYTAVLFTFIFFLTWLYNLFQVKLANPVELLRGGNVGEREPRTKWLLALVGVLAMGEGYYLAITTERPIDAIDTFIVAVVLVIIGTYCLFIAGSIAVLKALRKKKNFYYKANHFTAVSGMIYRMKQNAAGLANICILSTIVLVLISSTVSLYAGMEDILDQRFPYDYCITTADASDPSTISSIDRIVEEELSARHVEKEDGMSYRYGATAVLRQSDTAFTNSQTVDYTVEDIQGMYFIPQEDYQKVQGDPTELAPDEVILFVTDEGSYGRDTITVNGKELKVVKELKDFRLEDKSVARVVTGWYLIMPDVQSILDMGVVNGALQYSTYFDMGGSREDCLAAVQSIADRVGREVPGAVCENRELSRENFFSLYGSLFFIGLYLGSMFLIATVLIIYYKQISEGYDDRERYQIMQKVGMGKREVRRSIRSQVLLVFFLPLVAAVIHIAVAFNVIDKLLAMLGLVNTPLFLACTAATVLVFAVFYVMVFAVTAREYYKIVNE